MPLLDLKDNKMIEKYDNFVKGNKYSDVMQTINWAKLKSSWKCEIIYLTNEKDEFIASSMVLLRKIPVINSYLAYCPRGPILEKIDNELLVKLVEEFSILKKKYNIFCIKFDPNWKRNDIDKEKFKKFIFRDEVSTRKIIQPKLNMILELKNRTEQELLDSFSQTTRRHIRTAVKNNCEVVRMTSKEGLEIFHNIHEITGKRDNFLIRNKEYFDKMYDIFRENESLEIWLVKHENDVLGSTISLEYGDTMWYYAGASSNEKRNLMPNHLIQWEMIKYAKQKGYDYYNFGGIYSIDSNIEPLYIFKSGFCKKDGVTEYIGEIDYVYNKLKYNMYFILQDMNVWKNKIIRFLKGKKEKNV